MANWRGVAECWSQPNSKHSNVNVVRPSWPCESDARTYKLAPPDGGSGSAGSLKEGSLPGTYPGAAGRAHRQRWFWQKAGFAQGARRKPASRKGPKMVYNGLKPVYSLQK